MSRATLSLIIRRQFFHKYTYSPEGIIDHLRNLSLPSAIKEVAAMIVPYQKLESHIYVFSPILNANLFGYIELPIQPKN